MPRLQDLQQTRNHKALSAQDVVDRADKDNGRPLTPDECQLFDKLVEDVKGLDGQITALQETEKRRTEISTTINRLGESAGRQTEPDRPGRAAGDSPFRIPATARRTGALKAFKGRDAEERAFRAGMWALGNIFGKERASHWCANHGVGNVTNALSTTSNPDGGFLVPEEFSTAIIDLREQYGVFRQETRVVPMGRDTMTVPRRSGGITIGPVGENPASGITQSSPAWDQVRLTAKKAGGLCLMSTEISEDAAIDLADWIADEFAYAFALFEDQCGFIGDGTSTYLGIRGLENLLTESSALAGAVLAASGHDTLAEIDASDLASVMAKLPQYAKMNAKFYCSSVVDEMVFGRLMAAAGGNTVDTLQGTRGRSYLGYPIVISQVLEDSLGTINSTAILFFGDLSKSSTMGDRREVRVFPSEHRYMDTDQIGIRGTERFDIVNHDVGTTTVAGPIVALLGNT